MGINEAIVGEDQSHLFGEERAKISILSEGRSCTLRASDEWRTGSSLGLSDLPGKSKTTRRAGQHR